MKLFIILGAVMSFLFVAIGAFGAHALAARLEETGRTANFETGVQYHMIHAVAIVVVGILMQHLDASGLLYGAGWSFFIGILFFSGSLYVLSLTGITVMGAITPIGGLAFLTGWVLLIIAAFTG